MNDPSARPPAARRLAKPSANVHSMHDPCGLSALGVYFVLSLLFFGRGLIGHFTTCHIGKDVGDPALIAWFLRWLAHAVVRDVNPFYTNAVWAPASLNLAWTTWMPLVGFLLFPITLTLGPVASLNVIFLLALPLASWSAFVLYRYLTGSWWASLVGGYLFGFSGYMLYRLWEGDPQLLLVFPVALSLRLVLRALRDEIGPRVFVGVLATMLVVQFLISLEIFATATMFGMIAFALAWVLFENDTHRRLRALISPIIWSYAIALAVVSPYLYFFFAAATPRAPIWQPFLFSADLLFFLLPSWASEIGRFHPVAGIFAWMPYTTVAYVGFSYMGPVLLLIVTVFAWQHWCEIRTRFLVWMMLIAAILSCGPWLTVGGRRFVWMPGALLSVIPVMSNALPVWFTMYLMLAAALVVAMWLVSSGEGMAVKWVVVLAAVVFAMPRLSSAFWDSPVDTPRFFLNGAYREFLQPGEIVLPVPYGWHGNSLMWQAQTDMYFRMAGAWTGPPPAEFERWPAMVAMFNGTYLPESELQLKAFLAAHDVTAVLVDTRARDSADARQREEYRTVLAALGPAPVENGGMLIYRFTPASLAPWRGLNPVDLEQRTDEARFAAVLGAVQRYLRSGGEPALLTTAKLEQMGLIRGDWVGGPNIRISNGLWAHSNRDGTFDIGTFGSRAALAALIAKYRRQALRINNIAITTSESVAGEAELALMVMTFDSKGLERAAALAYADENLNSKPDNQ